MVQIFLVRHAEYDDNTGSLTSQGKERAEKLGKIIQEKMLSNEVSVWSSDAIRAVETAGSIGAQISPDIKIETKAQLNGSKGFGFFDEGLSDDDAEWLENEIESFNGKTLIIVTHMEFVDHYPEHLSFSRQDIGYAEGSILFNGEIQKISWKDAA